MNMKAKITTFSLKGKEDIWSEDVKNVSGVHEEELTWSDFEWRDTMMTRKNNSMG